MPGDRWHVTPENSYSLPDGPYGPGTSLRSGLYIRLDPVAIGVKTPTYKVRITLRDHDARITTQIPVHTFGVSPFLYYPYNSGTFPWPVVASEFRCQETAFTGLADTYPSNTPVNIFFDTTSYAGTGNPFRFFKVSLGTSLLSLISHTALGADQRVQLFVETVLYTKVKIVIALPILVATQRSASGRPLAHRALAPPLALLLPHA
jgi:hypothetical protein